jgi:preprotein translocase subunit SecD
MTQFPRWKYWVVIAATLVAGVLALPNFFGEDPALQLARHGYEGFDASGQAAVEAMLNEEQAAYNDAYVDNGRLWLRFDSTAERNRAREVIEAKTPDQYVIALTKAPRTPELLRNLGLGPMSLGLDLRGGLYLLYQVDVDGAVTQHLSRLEQDFRKTLRDERIPYVNIEPGEESTLRVTLREAAGLEAARAALLETNPGMSIEVDGDDAQPALVMRLTEQEIRERQDYAIEQNITTLRNRLNSPELAVSEPIVQRQGVDRIAVQLPGVQNSAEVIRILGKTASLEFRLADEANNAYEAAERGRAPLGSKLYYMDPARAGGEQRPVLLKREIIATGDDLTDATSGPSEDGPAVFVRLGPRGAAEMLRTTQANVGRGMGVVFIERITRTVERDGQMVKVPVNEERVISLATIRGVFSNSFQISGLQLAEARELALLLRAGSLAAPQEIVEERTIGPSLGQDNINKGLAAMVWGTLAVFAFMIVYYRGFGVIASVVLCVNVIFLMALLSLLQAALTLPGIAGAVLTVGMAVDANILIYERIREELRMGNSPLNAIESGFDKAFSAIADANVTTLIAGVVLWLFGTGAIKGFAVVLCLGIGTSMFTAILGSRVVIHTIWGRRRHVERLPIGGGL